MPKKTVIDITALDVKQVTVSADGVDGALIELQIDGQADIRVRLAPAVLAKLEAMLAAAAIEQAKMQPIQ
ncbi:MAG: hypothetical protein DCF30_15670 [Hyphomicrobiales bacterium]|nr:MAG: hypothetical protein DCF30_15670 [Hyphomicrobiales bacterium]